MSTRLVTSTASHALPAQWPTAELHSHPRAWPRASSVLCPGRVTGCTSAKDASARRTPTPRGRSPVPASRLNGLLRHGAEHDGTSNDSRTETKEVHR